MTYYFPTDMHIGSCKTTAGWIASYFRFAIYLHSRKPSLNCDSRDDKSSFVGVVCVHIWSYTTIVRRLRADVTLLLAAPVTSRTPVTRARNTRNVGRRFTEYAISFLGVKLHCSNLGAALRKRTRNWSQNIAEINKLVIKKIMCGDSYKNDYLQKIITPTFLVCSSLKDNYFNSRCIYIKHFCVNAYFKRIKTKCFRIKIDIWNIKSVRIKRQKFWNNNIK